MMSLVRKKECTTALEGFNLQIVALSRDCILKGDREVLTHTTIHVSIMIPLSNDIVYLCVGVLVICRALPLVYITLVILGFSILTNAQDDNTLVSFSFRPNS